MNIYLVETDEYHYDEHNGFVIYANDEEQARMICQVEDSEREIWFDQEKTKVVLLSENVEMKTRRIILKSFNAG